MLVRVYVEDFRVCMLNRLFNNHTHTRARACLILLLLPLFLLQRMLMNWINLLISWSFAHANSWSRSRAFHHYHTTLTLHTRAVVTECLSHFDWTIFSFKPVRRTALVCARVFSLRLPNQYSPFQTVLNSLKLLVAATHTQHTTRTPHTHTHAHTTHTHTQCTTRAHHA